VTLPKSQHDLKETAPPYTLMLITLTPLSAVLLTAASDGGHCLDTENTPTTTFTSLLEASPKSKICKNITNFPFIRLLQTSFWFRYQQFKSSPKKQFTTSNTERYLTTLRITVMNSYRVSMTPIVTGLCMARLKQRKMLLHSLASWKNCEKRLLASSCPVHSSFTPGK
jgi:hypothetical protein